MICWYNWRDHELNLQIGDGRHGSSNNFEQRVHTMQSQQESDEAGVKQRNCAV